MITVSNPFSNIPPLFSDLAKTIAGDIDCSLETLELYSKDGSPYMIRPQAVIYPKNTTDIKHILSFAREYTIPVTVRGSGSTRKGGSLGEGIVIDLKRYFDHIRQINMLDHTITVDAGVSIKTLREKLHALHVDIPILTSYNEDSTIGSYVSTKSVNPSSFNFGTVREWIEGMNIVVDTGEEHRIADGITPSGRLLGIYQAVFPLLSTYLPILRAGKPEMSDDATGYSIWNTSIGPRQLLDQLVGGEGTLGIVTSVTFRVTPHKEHTITLCLPIYKKENIRLYTDIARHHKAESIFMYDATFMELSDRYHYNLVPSFPEAIYTLLISFASEDKEKLHTSVRTCIRVLGVDPATIKEYPDTNFLERVSNKRFLFSLLHAYTQGSHTPNTACDGIIVPLHNYTNLLEELEDYLYSTGKLYTITGNVGSGHISVITLFDPQGRTYEYDIDLYTQTIFGYVKKYKGGISADGGEGLIRTPFISYIYNEATLDVFKKIKQAWDPLMILNPGKKLSVTKQYLNDHLIKTVEEK